MKLLDDVKADAVLSPCGTYRYMLTRQRYPLNRTAVWIMLNPSTADADVDDPTLRRVQSFSFAWGFGDIVVLNLFALRSPDPALLRGHEDPVGPDNDDIIATIVQAPKVGVVVAGWGAHEMVADRGRTVADMVVDAGHDLYCLGLTKNGQPRHPLYVRGDTPTVVWRACP